MSRVLPAAPQYCLSLDRLRNKPSREKAPAAAVTNPMALIARLACKGGSKTQAGNVMSIFSSRHANEEQAELIKAMK